MAEPKVIYTTTYTTVFAVMFSVLAAISQQFGAFSLYEGYSLGGWYTWSDLAKVGSAILVTILFPAAFFVAALLAIDDFPEELRSGRLALILCWVAPIYGLQQLWLVIARLCQWTVKPEILTGPCEAQIFLFVVCGIGPFVLLVLFWPNWRRLFRW